jgi:hypothetical protein
MLSMDCTAVEVASCSDFGQSRQQSDNGLTKYISFRHREHRQWKTIWCSEVSPTSAMVFGLLPQAQHKVRIRYFMVGFLFRTTGGATCYPVKIGKNYSKL